MYSHRCDTLWMVLKKKSSVQMSFLHLYHHATIGVVWGLLLSLGHGNGTAQYGAFINSVTHVIMYSHYFITGLGGLIFACIHDIFINRQIDRWTDGKIDR